MPEFNAFEAIREAEEKRRLALDKKSASKAPSTANKAVEATKAIKPKDQIELFDDNSNSEMITKRPRGRPIGGGEPNEGLAPIVDWTPRHQMAVSLHLTGWGSNQIGAALGWTPGRVSQILKDPKAKEIIKNNIKAMEGTLVDMNERFKILSHEALDTTAEIMRESAKDELRLRASTSVLDRAGHTPIQRQITLRKEIPADPELLARLKATMDDLQEVKIVYSSPPEPPLESTGTEG